MPHKSKGPRLWLRPTRRNRSGEVTHQPTWVIRDGRLSQGTRCGHDDRRGAEQALGEYIARKYLTATTSGRRDPDQIPIANVLALYANDVAPQHARPHETAKRVAALLRFFGADTLATVNGARCRQYVASRTTPTMARKELEDLRAAINHHRREGLCSEVVEVSMPPAPRARERWLTRDEVARLIWAAWRYREKQKGNLTQRYSRRHVARFVLVALYTGTRASAICGAALQPTEGRGWVDLKRGVFYRRAPNARVTKKRAPPIPLPAALLGHMRRWRRNNQDYVVEWNGGPVLEVKKAFRKAARAAGLGPGVSPHTLRHTAATWLMQAGTDLWEAAGYLGMTVEMLSLRYGHHHPNHLSGARNAFSRHRRLGREPDAATPERPAVISATIPR